MRLGIQRRGAFAVLERLRRDHGRNRQLSLHRGHAGIGIGGHVMAVGGVIRGLFGGLPLTRFGTWLLRRLVRRLDDLERGEHILSGGDAQRVGDRLVHRGLQRLLRFAVADAQDDGGAVDRFGDDVLQPSLLAGAEGAAMPEDDQRVRPDVGRLGRRGGERHICQCDPFPIAAIRCVQTNTVNFYSDCSKLSTSLRVEITGM